MAITSQRVVRPNTVGGIYENTIVKAFEYNRTVADLQDHEDRIADIEDGVFTIETFSTDTISEATAATGVTVDNFLIKDGGFVAAGAIDANGQEFILDADADTSITADTDDQIDIRISAADDFRFTANTFTSLSGSSIATNTIVETTAASGVTIDSVLIKDSTIALGDGGVGDLSVKIGADLNNGLYGVSDTQLGIAVEGTLVGGANTLGLFTDNIAEQTSTVGVTIDSALIKDGSFTGKQATATATADGLTTGLLTGTDQFVTITSANADHIIALPLSTGCPIGTKIRGLVGANGCELRVDASELATAKINDVTTSVEAAIPADTFIEVTKVAALTWILTATTKLGAVVTAIIPDAV